MPTTSAWPFGTDAKATDPLTKLRIPVVTSPNPRWSYVAAYIDVNPEPYGWGSKERPTGREARMIASFVEEYKNHWYNERYKAKLAQRPLDVDGGCNTTIFIKYGTDDWGYRLCSWIYGPTFVPEPPHLLGRKLGPLTLEQVMDRTHTISSGEPRQSWLDWKTAHPEVFGGRA